MPSRAAIAADHEADADALGFEVVDHLRGFLRAARSAEHGAALVMNVCHRIGRKRQQRMTVACDQPLVTVAETADVAHAVA